MIFGKDKEKMSKLEQEVGSLKYQLAEAKKEIINRERRHSQARGEIETHYRNEEIKINSDYQKLEEIIKEKYLSGDEKAKINLKKSLEAERFFNKIYEHFTKEFSKRINDEPNGESLKYKKEDILPEDKTWLFQKSLEIAMHTADYTEHYIKEDREYYHHNYELLKNYNLNISEANKHGEIQEFIENDIMGSTHASNAICKACRSLGIKEVRFLVSRYDLNKSLKNKQKIK